MVAVRPSSVLVLSVTEVTGMPLAHLIDAVQRSFQAATLALGDVQDKV